MAIVELDRDKGSVCERILRSLPMWFGIEEAIREYVRDVEGMTTFADVEDGAPVGFLALRIHNEWTAEVHVMAVEERCHRRGIGSLLLSAAEAHLARSGHEFLTVKTLSASRPNAEYEKTRQFYFAKGFRPIEEFKDLWGPANPCLLMAKRL